MSVAKMLDMTGKVVIITGGGRGVGRSQGRPDQFVQFARRRLGPKVRGNAVTAGLIVTEQSHLHYGEDAGIAAVSRTIPLQRMAIPTDIGHACLYLASPLSSYVNGTSIVVHGGGETPAVYEAPNTQPEMH